MEGAASVWEEEVIIPTYPVGEPERNPIFLENRVYQGSSGAVYPLPVIERLTDEKEDRTYHAVFLENEYLKVMILPELGGRVQMAYAKTLDYHFVYYNRVIKPALVGLAGPWISGGIEFNWPQHHRPSTFMPVDHVIEKAEEGRATVWLAETDRMRGSRSVAGLSLYPGKAYLEVSVRLSNPTLFPQTFLWWANPAVPVNDQYQSVFPPDVNAVFDHGKRDVSRFPIATGTYYKVDYSAGVDISWYRNIPVPTSYMAYHSDFDFVGGYDHGRNAGILHVADHHVSPGKKLWTWGNGEFGKAWEWNLTDADGPYIELMTGVFTDNQPDFSWLEPGEQKHFIQSFLPYAGIGMVKNASRDAAISLDLADGMARVGACSTARRKYHVVLGNGAPAAGTPAGGPAGGTPSGGPTGGAPAGGALLDATAEISPEAPYVFNVPLPPGSAQGLTLSLQSLDGEVSISYSPQKLGESAVPDPASPAPPPSDVGTQEELYLIGIHLEQYRHATFRPEDYYAEALHRDPGDSRCALAMGLLLLRRGDFAGSEQYFRTAIRRVTTRNPNPQDGASFLYLGTSLEMQDKLSGAEDAYSKAAWSAGSRAAAHAGLARCAMKQGNFAAALARAGESLAAYPRDVETRCMKAIALRRLGRFGEAEAAAESALAEDPLCFLAANERELARSSCLAPAARPSTGFRRDRRNMGDPARTAKEVASQYVLCGLFPEAISVLLAAEAPDNPLLCFWLGYCFARQGDREAGISWIKQADSLPQGASFAGSLLDVPVLELAGSLFPEGARAWYHLGNLLYANRLFSRAIEAWERAKQRDLAFPTVRRNLALAAFNKLGDARRARAELEQAFLLDPTDARVLMELHQLLKRLAVDPAERFHLLSRHRELVFSRDDLSVEWVSLLTLRGDYREALEILEGRKFHPWEGGEGRATGQYTAALLGLCKTRLLAGDAVEAADLARRALQFPPNLGEGRLPGAVPNDVWYYLGCAQEAAGDMAGSRDSLGRASAGEKSPAISLYYNDQPADLIFFQGLALALLGRKEEAQGRFTCLFDYGERNRDRPVEIDYFAVSLPDMLIFDDDLSRRARVFCAYLQALGTLGMGDAPRARALLSKVRAEEPSHAGACETLRDMDNRWKF